MKIIRCKNFGFLLRFNGFWNFKSRSCKASKSFLNVGAYLKKKTKKKLWTF